MSLKNYRLESKLATDYRIKRDKYYSLYVLENNLMLKKYLLNEDYMQMLAERDSDYLEYLRELMNYSSDFIVKPIDVYVKHSLVTSYTYQKEAGTSITEMFPKTRMDKLLEAISEMYEHMDELKNFRLAKISPNDIFYTGQIKINNVEKSEFGNNEDSKKVLDDLLLRGIFHIDGDEEIIITNEQIKSLYEKMIEEDIDLINFFHEYMRFVREEYGNCKYVRHLNHGIIKGVK